jgi:hypothetical protein
LAISAVYTGIIMQISEKVEGGIVILLLLQNGATVIQALA